MPNTCGLVLSIAIALLAPTASRAQITTWQLGGSQPWAGRDTVSIMVDFASVDGAIQPVRIEPGIDGPIVRTARSLGICLGDR